MKNHPTENHPHNLLVSRIAFAIALGAPLAAIVLHLVPALLAGLLIYVLVHSMAPRLERHLSNHAARLAAVALLAFIVLAAIGALTLGTTAFLHSDAGSLPALMEKLAEVLESSRTSLPAWAIEYLPANSTELQTKAAAWLREHAGALQKVGKDSLMALVHAVLGMVIGAMLALREVDAERPGGPLSRALGAHAARFATAFQQVVFAQVQIAAINATLTGVYLVIVLGLFGIHLPLAKTMVILTFIVGLLPVVGNLISNTAIVILSLSHSLELAVLSLVFLVVLHKLEYFLNAKIVGDRIKARSWELLLAMLTMEAIFGISGLVMAPIYYAYLKAELGQRGLI